MRRYESYLTRRVPLGRLVYPTTDPNFNKSLPTGLAAQDRLYAIRDIMRMEMPDHSERRG